MHIGKSSCLNINLHLTLYTKAHATNFLYAGLGRLISLFGTSSVAKIPIVPAEKSKDDNDQELEENQEPQKTRYTILENDKSISKQHTQKRQRVSFFPKGDHMAARDRQGS